MSFICPSATSSSFKRRRRSSSSGKRKSGREIINGTTKSSTSCKEVAKRLQALKDLIPRRSSMKDQDMMSCKNITADQLFEDTAGYILLLRTQVEVLNHLVQICDHEALV